MFLRFLTCDHNGFAISKVMLRIKDIQHFNPAINYSYSTDSSAAEIKTPIPGVTSIQMLSGLHWFVLMEFDELADILSNMTYEDVK